MTKASGALCATAVLAVSPAVRAVPLAPLAAPVASEPVRAGGCPSGMQAANTLVVGYEEAAPFAFTQGDGHPSGFAVDLLQELAGSLGKATGNPSLTLSFVPLPRESLRSRVRDCAIDVAITGEPMSVALEPGTEYSLPYVDTAAVIATTRKEARREGILGASASPVWHALGSLGCGVVAAMLLATLVMLLNVRVTWTRGESPPWAITSLDREVQGPWAATRWLMATRLGRFVLAGWFLVGAFGWFAWGTEGPAEAGVRHDTRYDAALTAAVRGTVHEESADPGAPHPLPVGVRRSDGTLMTCGTEANCLREVGTGSLAAVAGNRDALCTARQGDDAEGDRRTDLDEIVFAASPTLPERFAFVLPRGGPWRSALDTELLRAIGQGASGPVERIFTAYSIASPWNAGPYACRTPKKGEGHQEHGP